MISPLIQEQIVSCFERMSGEPIDLTRRFYQVLFERAPEARALFKDEIDKQAHKLLDMLMFLVQSLEELDVLMPEIENLGRRHAAFGVKEEYYRIVTEALLEALEGTVSQWSDDDEAAWKEFLTIMADRMIASAKSANAAA